MLKANYQQYTLPEDEMIDIIGDNHHHILLKDSHPKYQAYVIAHEGEAESTDRQVYRYVRHAIQRIHDVLKLGTDIFFTHSKKNRVKIGEVIGKTTKEINGVLNTIAVVYLYPEYHNLDVDVASIEASVSVTPDNRIDNIVSVSAIALSDGEKDTPGFKNAKLIQQLSYFASQQTGDSNMNIEDVKKWIQESNIDLINLFPAEQIVAHPTIDSIIKAQLQTKHEHARRLENKLGDTIKGFEEERNQLLESIKEYRGKIWGLNLNETISNKLSELNEPQPIKDMLAEKVKNRVDLSKIDDEKVLEREIVDAFNAEYTVIEEIKKMYQPQSNPTKPNPTSIPKPSAPDSRSDEDKAIDDLLNI